jgi:hypothetical protein
MATETKTYAGLMHAGAGTGLGLVQLSVLIPGVLPTLALLGIFTAVVVLPLLALGLVAAVLAAPPYIVWRLATRRGARSASVTTST